MKNKFVLLGMILSFQLFISDVFGQLSRTVTYGYTGSLSGGTQNYPGSLIPIPAGGYLYFPRHKNITGGATSIQPEIAFLDNNLDYVSGSPLTFTLPSGKGAVIHEAKCIDPTTYPDIYAIVGSFTNSNTGEFEDAAFAFLYDIVSGASSDVVSLEINMTGTTGLSNQMDVGLGFINVADANIADGMARCLVVHTNPYQPSNGTTFRAGSTLNLLYIDPLAMDLTLQHIYDLHPNNSTPRHIGIDMEVDGNAVITLSTYGTAGSTGTYSELSRFDIGYTSGTTDFFVQSPTAIVRRRIINGASGSSNPSLFLNKIQLIGDKIVLSGNVGNTNSEKGIILDFQLTDFFSTSVAPVINNVTKYWDGSGTRTFSRSGSIDPTNSNRIAVYSSSNGISSVFTPQISFYNLTSHTFENLENSTTNNAIGFLWTGQQNGGVGRFWSPICCNNNQVLIASTGGPTNVTYQLRNSLYAYNANGIESPAQTNECVAAINYSSDENYIHITQHTYECLERDTVDRRQEISMSELNLESTESCYEPPSCIPLLATVVDCQEIQLSVPGYTNVSWNDNGSLSTGPYITITDLDCHHLEYSFAGAECSQDFRACLTPGECESQRTQSSKQPAMTRWTLDNTVTDFANAQKQMKDGNKHTLCYEKYSEKNGKFEQISCEEVQSTEDLTKVEFDFTAYPSPASDNITIDVTNFTTEDNFKAILFTSSGSNIKEFKLKSKTAQYSLEGVNSGSYILTMYQGNKKVSSKTIIVRK